MCVFFTPFDTDIIAARLNFCSLQVNAFQRQGVFKNASVDQRKRFIVFAMRYMVTFMTILEKIYSALYSCRKGSESSVEDGTRYLDIAVGYYVGSLEGKDDGGSFDGSLIHMLAKRMCVHFGTCTASNHARINEIENLLMSPDIIHDVEEETVNHIASYADEVDPMVENA